MKNYYLDPSHAIAGDLSLQREKDDRWTLNADGVAIQVFASEMEALAYCIDLVNRSHVSLRIQTPEGVIEGRPGLHPVLPVPGGRHDRRTAPAVESNAKPTGYRSMTVIAPPSRRR